MHMPLPHLIISNRISVNVQLGNIISANIYRTSDAPLYHKGNTHLIIINILVILLFLFTKFYYVTRNRLREKKWNAMTIEVSRTLTHPSRFMNCGRKDSADKMMLLGERILPEYDNR